ncbi:MAG: alpha/beta fold hydrolase [Chloroflexota bacterium]
MKSKTSVFIHGMFMTPLCWEHWVAYFQAQGYTCTAPAWPGRDPSVETLRARHPDPELGRLTLSQVVEHCANHVKSLAEKPILIGHSMGGLVVQLLLQRDIAAAGVAINSAPPVGVFTTKWSFLKANFPMINPFISGHRPRLMSFEDFQYAFVNTLPPAEQKAAYGRYVVPESRLIPRESLTRVGRVDFQKQRSPLLLIAGAADHIVPASLNQSNYAKYSRSSSVTDFKEFAGRVHFIIGQPGWQEVADYVLTWLNEKAI